MSLLLLFNQPSASVSVPKTRLGYEGYGVRRAATFADKAGTGAAHPVGKITRLSADGYGARRVASFANKTAASTNHIVTRLGEGGYGVRRYGNFANKTPSTASGGTTNRPRLFMANVGRLMN